MDMKIISKQTNKMMVNHKSIKINIKTIMNAKNMGLLDLSKKSGVNIFVLMFLLYSNFSKLKLSNAIKICNALEIEVSEIFF
jgi:DNA-binding Xre family transcriptional regulator